MISQPRHLDPAYRRALIICACLNLTMLLVEGSMGLWIGSAALLADAVDFLEDAAVLALAVVALNWSVQARGRAGLVQGLAMAAVGVGAVTQIVWRLCEGGAPSAVPMGAIALLALGVNLFCAYRLISFRVGDSSMRAIWLSSRNDAIFNMMTAAAAGVIALTRSGWPDLIAGTIIAGVNLWASVEVIGAATKEMRAPDLS